MKDSYHELLSNSLSHNYNAKLHKMRAFDHIRTIVNCDTLPVWRSKESVVKVLHSSH